MNVTRDRSTTQSRWTAVLRWLALAWVGAGLLFAHGCHGNEDHELFTALARVIGAM